MKVFRNRKTAKANFTGRKTNTTKMRFVVLASIVLVAITSTVAFSSITTAGSLGELLFGGTSLSNTLFNASVQDDSKKDAKSSRLMQLAPDSLVSELTSARSGHTATRLDDTKVLITGGDAGGTAEIFDAATGTSAAAGSLNAARSGHTATKLADGRVLILGGTSYGAAVASTEIFDASTGTFSAGATMNAARSGHTATVLEGGKILIAGGDLVGSAEVYYPAAGTFTAISTLTTSRAGHSAALMKDGRVLFVGGSDAQGGELNSAEIYDPAASTFAATGNEMAHHRTNALLRVLPDGKVQIIGGNNDLSMEVYDPAIDTIGAHAHLIPTNDEHDALLQSDLLSAPSRAAMFHNGQSDALFDRSNFTVTELGNQALVAGGANTGGTALSSLTVVNSSDATVTTDKLDYQPGQIAVISGTGWQANETVNIILHEDPHTHTERRLTTTADANGNFSGNYLVEPRDLDVTFIIGAKGQTSGKTAQTTFTDTSGQIVKIAFNTVNQPASFTAGASNIASSPLRVQMQNTGNTGENITGGGSVILTVTTNSATGGFSTGTAGPFTSSISLTATSGSQNTPDFFYRDTKAGSVTFTATVTDKGNTGLSAGPTPAASTATLTKTVNAASPSKLVFITPSFQTVTGQCGSPAGLPITIQSRDDFDNPSSPAANKTINLTSSSAGGKFYSDAQCTREIINGTITSFVISNAGNSAGFYYKDTTAGTPTITAADAASALTSANQTETILVSSSCTALNFSRTNFAVGNTAIGVAVGDFNSDGKADIVSANSNSNNVSILLNNGAGGFLAATNIAVGNSPFSVAVGDFNSDGKADIASANSGSASVSILIGNGAGGFSAATNFAVGLSPRFVAIGDFNSDGKADIASANTNSNNVSILLNNGSGGFLAATNIAVGNSPYGVAVGDFNSDGKADIVSANTGSASVSILIGNGAGGFSAATNIAVLGSPVTPAVGDFNSDGKADIAISHDNLTNNVSILINNGTGGFSGPTSFTAGQYALSINIGDFNGDSKLDLATANNSSSNVSILTGNGLGSFSTATNFAVGSSPWGSAVGDFNADGKADVVTANSGSNNVSVLLNSCTSAPDLTITKTHTGNFTIGTNGIYTLTVSNAANASATSGAITVTDTLPTGLSFVSGTGTGWSCSATGQNVSCSMSNSLAAGATSSAITLTVGVGSTTPVGTNSITNTASVATTGETNTANNSASDPTTVNKGSQTITFGTLDNKTYGEDDFTVSATASSDLPVTFAASGNCSLSMANVVHITGAGSCTITASQGGNAAYNAATDVPQSFNIGKATLTVTAQDKSREYGDANPTFSVLLSDFVGGETLSTSGVSGTPNCSTTAVAASPVSPPTYPISCATGSLAANNYSFNFVDGNLTVTKATLTVSAANANREYGDSNPTFAPQYGSFKNGETSAVLTTAPTCTSAATAASPASPPTYSIVCSGGASGNYDFVYVDGALTITKAALTVTANDKSRAYGAANPAFDVLVSGFKNGETLGTSGVTETPDCSTTAVAASPANTYPINCSAGSLTAANYTFNFVSGTLTVTKADLIVTAENKSRSYGAANPSLTYTISGFVNGENEATANVTGAPSLSTTAAAASPVGNYTITAAVGTLSAPNYNFLTANGNLEITAAVLTVSADNLSKNYGDANPTLVYSLAGFVNGEDAASAGVSGTPVLSTTAATNSGIGNYPITVDSTGTLTAANYSFAASTTNGTLTVNARAITVTADAQTKTYGNADPSLTYQVTSGSLVSGDTFTGGLVRAPGESVGNYAITQGTLTLNTNYNLTFAGADLTITARAVTVTADAQSKTYGDADPVLTYQITNGSLAFSDDFTGSLTRTAGSSVGNYPILQGNLALNANYTLNYVGADLTITARAITITADAQSKIYGETDPALTYQITGGTLVSGDGFSGSITRTSGANVGNYPITQGTLALSSNYALTFIGADLTINARAVTVTADAKNKTYGSIDPSLTYQITGGSLVTGDGFTGGLARAAGETVGDYAITQGSLALNANYTLSYIGANLSITPKAASVTPDATGKIYGDGDPTFTGTLNGFLDGDAVTAIYSRNSGETVGGFTISAVLSPAGVLGNYNITYNTAAFTISKKTASITPDAASKSYGDTDPSFTGTLTGFLTADGVSAVYSRTIGETVAGNPYTISAALSPAGVLGNYDITYNTASFIINKKTLTGNITAANKDYDGNTTATIANRTLSGVVGSDVVNYIGGTANFVDKNVGNGKTVNATGLSLSGADAGNYNVNSAAATTADIAKRTLTVSATAQNKVFDGTTSATVMLSDNRVTNDVLNISFVSATFDNANIGTGKTVTVSGISISGGADAGNYMLSSTTASTTANITAAGTTTSVTVNPSSVQYSDTVTFNATVVATNTSLSGQLSGTVQFRINGMAFGNPVAAIVNASGGTASLMFNNQLAPNGYNVSAVFTSTNSNFSGSTSGTAALTITREDARLDYTGMTFVNTTCATCGTATVQLSATVKDITAIIGDPAYDANAGNISNATLTFVNKDTNADIATVPISLVSAGDTKVGTAVYNWSVNIGSSDSDATSVGFRVNGYYTRYDSNDDEVITVSKPIGTNFITGGGHIINSASAGLYAGGAGLKTNFGFNVKYNKSGKNLQGNVNVIIRAVGGKVYQIKGNQMDTLTADTTKGTAYYTGKANLTDITDPLSPISLGGGHSFQMKLTDKGEPGSSDTIGITLYANNTGALLFSSNWNGTTTIEQLLRGGNLVVR